MKDFDYYTYRFDAPSRTEKKKQLISEINEQKLTASERASAISKVPKIATDWYNEQMKPHHDAQNKLTAEFWADCRVDLGYDKFLGPNGMRVIENMASEEHTYGFGDIYSRLEDLVELARTIISDCKKS